MTRKVERISRPLSLFVLHCLEETRNCRETKDSIATKGDVLADATGLGKTLTILLYITLFVKKHAVKVRDVRYDLRHRHGVIMEEANDEDEPAVTEDDLSNSEPDRGRPEKDHSRDSAYQYF